MKGHHGSVSVVFENMNCLCNLFDSEVFWLIIIALILLYATCNGGIGCGTGSSCGTPTYGGCGCG